MRNHSTARLTTAEMESVCKDWFLFAKDKNSGGKERKKRKLSEIAKETGAGTEANES